MKSINDWQKKGVAEQIGDYFKLGWVFDKWYEKLILVGLCLLGIWKIIGFFS